ncbi:MAG TPA: hypothetical protein VJN19_03925 [Propionibacteriaceae bacterium]|nr:hypothetical protein [Propionibacteriaceae bacterium]
MNKSESLLPLAEITDRLRVTGRGYVGVCSIPIAKIIGSVDRACEFDRDFHPQRRDSDARMRALQAAFPDGDFPAISVFEVGGAYFVSDGHHRVALAHERGQEYIEAEVVRLATNYRLSPDVNIPQLVHTELRRMFMEESGLQPVRPDLDITFSNPAGYLELLETVKAHGWDLARQLGRLPSLEELATSWLAEVYQPGLRALHEAGLSCPHPDATEADSFLWLYQRRRSLWMRGVRASYRDAVYDIRHPRRLSRRERRELREAAAGLEMVDAPRPVAM